MPTSNQETLFAVCSFPFHFLFNPEDWVITSLRKVSSLLRHNPVDNNLRSHCHEDVNLTRWNFWQKFTSRQLFIHWKTNRAGSFPQKTYTNSTQKSPVYTTTSTLWYSWYESGKTINRGAQTQQNKINVWCTGKSIMKYIQYSYAVIGFMKDTAYITKLRNRELMFPAHGNGCSLLTESRGTATSQNSPDYIKYISVFLQGDSTLL